MSRTTRVVLLCAALSCVGATAVAPPASADPGFRADPSELLFDFVPVGATAGPRTINLFNPGTSPNKFGAISIEGSAKGDFHLVADDCSGRTLPSGGGCQVQITFRPTAAGTRLAALKVPDSTACNNWVDLAGSGSATRSTPRARAAICSAPEQNVPTQITPSGNLPTVQSNSIIDGPKKDCVSRRRFRIRLAAPRGTTIERAHVLVAGKRVKTEKVDGRTTAIVDLRGSRRRTAVVDITIWASNGRQYKGKRTYRTCAGKEAGGSPRY